jgi:hypothetical protein
MPNNFEVAVGGNALIRLFIDNSPLVVNAGAASANLSAGEYVLSWVVLGAPGDTYSLEITKPAGAAWKTAATIDTSGKDAGIHWVVI